MSTQPITYESVLELIQSVSRAVKEQGAEFDRRMREADRLMQERAAEFRQEMQERAAEFDRLMQERDARYEREKKETNRKIGELTGSMGKVIERMVAGKNIIKQFKDLGYAIESLSKEKTFGEGLPDEFHGEIDLFLENGDVAIIIEVKTTLKAKNVGRLIDKIEKFRRVSDLKGDKRRFIGAVAGAVVEGDAKEVAHENGIHVIVQSGKAMEIAPVPAGFNARQW